jgi:beta-lactam-binding protein with PASTA domain
MHALRCLIVLYVLVLGLAACGTDEDAVMPDVAGKRLDVALSDIKHAGYEDAPEVISDAMFGVLDESNWVVCEQEPAPGEALEETPRLTVDRSCPDDEPDSAQKQSEEPSMVTVPEIQGDRMSTVYDQLESAGLVGNARNWDQYHFAVDVRPPPGTQVEPGSVVRITTMTSSEIRFYRKHKQMPELVGGTLDDALVAMGPHFMREKHLPGSSSMSQSSVITRQSPPPGGRLTPKTDVFIEVVWRPVSGGFDIPGIDVDVDVRSPCSYTRYC